MQLFRKHCTRLVIDRKKSHSIIKLGSCFRSIVFPFHAGSIYFQKENGFANSPELDDEINSKKKNQTIDMIVKYAEGKVK